MPRSADPTELRRRLLRWYDVHQRELPWRDTDDPWAVLVSEIMLQQTTVAAVLPYYERFLARWPSPAALAAAEPDEVLAAWAGLGYYGRARRLQQAACLVAEAGGNLPGDYAGLLELPGVGAYTAAAVASIAFGQAVPVLDGNVERVLTRLAALPGDPRKAETAAAVRALAARLLSPTRPGDFNQALMELGATVCRPRAPRCPRCPLEQNCLARADGEPERFPALPPREASQVVTRVALVVLRRGRLLAVRRSEPPNAGFLELPGLDVAPERLGSDGTPADGPGELVQHLARQDLEVRVGRKLPLHRHTITRYRIRVHPYRGTLCSGTVRPPFAWTVTDGSAPLTTATRRILARVAADSSDTEP